VPVAEFHTFFDCDALTELGFQVLAQLSIPPQLHRRIDIGQKFPQLPGRKYTTAEFKFRSFCFYCASYRQDLNLEYWDATFQSAKV
jgi:hypothetical protein